MLRKIVVIVLVVAAGFMTGYFSRPLYHLIWSGGETKTAARGGAAPVGGPARPEPGSSQQYIAKEQAIDAAKDFAPVRRIARAAEIGGFNLEYAAEEPTGDYPVWLVVVRETHPDRLPVTMYIQVDAVSGKVLSLQDNDFALAGVRPGMTRREVAGVLGRPAKSRKKYDAALGQNIRTDSYPGVDVAFDGQGKVVRITLPDGTYAGPGGVKVGETRAVVARKLGKADQAGPDLLEYRSVESGALRLLVRLDNAGSTAQIAVEKVTG